MKVCGNCVIPYYISMLITSCSIFDPWRNMIIACGIWYVNKPKKKKKKKKKIERQVYCT